jgi:hypothetical protein
MSVTNQEELSYSTVSQKTGARASQWNLPRFLMLLLAGMFVGLMMDIRVEHVEVVHEKTVAWLPIFFSAIMAVVSFAAFIFWNRAMRWLILLLCIGSMAVGLTGTYLHSHGYPNRILNTSIRSWTDKEMTHPDGPPLTAPMAFVGFGVLGALATLKPFNR